MNRVVVGAVNLDAVKTGFSSERSSLSKACNQAFNLIWSSSPLASLLPDATMQLQTVRADIAHRSIRALRCGHRHISGGSQDLPQPAWLQRADADWTNVHHVPHLFPARSARPVRHKRRKKWWLRIRRQHVVGQIRVRVRSPSRLHGTNRLSAARSQTDLPSLVRS